MSHFNLHVFTATPPAGHLDEIMERYDEAREVAPHVAESIPVARAQEIRDKYYPGKSVSDAISDWEGEDVRWSDDAAGYEVISARNPESKWDWWTIGGRWDKGLVTTGGQGVNSARLEELDWDERIAEQVAAANKRYDQFEQATVGLVVPPTYKELIDSGIDHYEARKQLHANPWVIAARSVNPDMLTWPHYEYCVNDGGRDAYVARRARPDAPFAWIDLEGEWHEHGEMGLFGVVRVEKDFAEHADAYRAYRDSLPGDTYVTLIDCHI